MVEERILFWTKSLKRLFVEMLGRLLNNASLEPGGQGRYLKPYYWKGLPGRDCTRGGRGKGGEPGRCSVSRIRRSECARKRSDRWVHYVWKVKEEGSAPLDWAI